MSTGPPRFRMPLDRSKIRRADAPPNLIELLESSTGALPAAAAAAAPPIGTGSGVAAPPPEGAAPAAAPRTAMNALGTAGTVVRPKAPGTTAAPRASRAEPLAAEGVTTAGVTTATGTLSAPLAGLKARYETVTGRNPIAVRPDAYVPTNRKAFKTFMIQTYKRYKLPPVPTEPDPDACAKQAAASKSEVKSFEYQSFVRDFIQRASPYRGVLVYHGLGSGKTCTSIASMEALQASDKTKPVYVMTPASLNPNYRDEITKCGPFIFRTQNHWTFVPVLSMRAATPESDLLLKTVGLPLTSVRKRKGGWVPDPAKPPNFDSKTTDERRDIQAQIFELMDQRFTFINYNGLTEKTLRAWSCERPTMFDGATIVVDEIHNLIRTINNSAMESMYTDEPRDLATYIPKFCETGHKYRISYLFYRMLVNSVGTKIIGLSATPIINFPQEIAILANILAGDMRMVEASIPGLGQREALIKLLTAHPEVDFVEVLPRPESGTSFVRISPVPSGCRKVIEPATGDFRGFIRDEALAATPEESNRERNLEAWLTRVNTALAAKGLPELTKPQYKAVPRLPDVEKTFRELFIDTDKLEVKPRLRIPLMERLSGLISYYKGGKADLMARVTRDEEVLVDMSDLQLKKYTDQRKAEIERELKKSKKAPAPAQPGKVGYADATKSVNTTFKIFSRSACNFAFPDEYERPIPRDYRDVLKMVGAHPGQDDVGEIITKDDVAEPLDEEGAPVEEAVEGAAGVAAAGEAEAAEAEGAVAEQVEEANAAAEGAAAVAAANARPGAAAVAAAPPRTKALTYDEAIVEVLVNLKARSAEFFNRESLMILSPKFQAILDRLLEARGPALVYSNFKTLEGVGLFSLALEAQQGFVKLDVVPAASGGWTLSPETLAGPPTAPRYIAYTGDEKREKRKLLLDIFNNKWSKVPGALAEQVKAFMGTDTNKNGQIARVFMITQSGAEGISLTNVRQVHLMEPYWNYVRLEQVKGRAIRICSHMDLPPKERTVDVFTYISKFSDKQRAERKVIETLINFDAGETTDQSILKLMKAKKHLADSIVDVMKASAVDCELNATENGAISCYRLNVVDPSIRLFHPMTDVHVREAEASVRTATVRRGGE